MQIHIERRQTTLSGAAILSGRATVGKLALKAAFRSAGIAARVLPLEEGAFSEVRPPIVLDVVGLAPRPLAGYLLQLSDARLTSVVIVEGNDTVVQYLATACPVVRALLTFPAGLVGLAPWLRQFADPTALPIPTAPRWFGLPPLPPLDLPPAFLAVLKALIGASTMDVAAARSKLPTRTFYRALRASRAALGVPFGRSVRYTPDKLASALLEAIAGADVCQEACAGDNEDWGMAP